MNLEEFSKNEWIQEMGNITAHIVNLRKTQLNIAALYAKSQNLDEDVFIKAMNESYKEILIKNGLEC